MTAVLVVGADGAAAANDAAATDVAAGDGGRDDEGVEAGGCPMSGAPASPTMVECPESTGTDARAGSRLQS